MEIKEYQERVLDTEMPVTAYHEAVDRIHADPRLPWYFVGMKTYASRMLALRDGKEDGQKPSDTAIAQYHTFVNGKKNIRILHALMGIAGETFEITENIMSPSEVTEPLIGEIGDLMYYGSLLCTAVGIELENLPLLAGCTVRSFTVMQEAVKIMREDIDYDPKHDYQPNWGWVNNVTYLKHGEKVKKHICKGRDLPEDHEPLTPAMVQEMVRRDVLSQGDGHDLVASLVRLSAMPASLLHLFATGGHKDHAAMVNQIYALFLNLADVCNKTNVDMTEAMVYNIAKLRDRHAKKQQRH